MVTIDREQLACATGFFNGEGSTSIRRHKAQKPRVVLTISQTSREVLDQFNAAVGNLCSVTGPYLWSANKPVYRLGVTKFERVQAIVAMLWLWLSTEKKEQYKKCLRDYGNLSDRRSP